MKTAVFPLSDNLFFAMDTNSASPDPGMASLIGRYQNLYTLKFYCSYHFLESGKGALICCLQSIFNRNTCLF